MPLLSLASPLPPGTGGSVTLRLDGLAASPSPSAFFVLGLSRQQWGPLSLPWPLTGLGAPTCSLHVAPDLIVGANAQAGAAELTVPVPGSALFHAQGLVLDSKGLALSGAASIETGSYRD